MRILVLGAGGFIGREILSDLLANGHEILGVARSAKALIDAFPGVCFHELDLAQATRPEIWGNLLAGVDAVVNAAGLLRGRDMEAVHVSMPKALYAAAEVAKVKHVVLISAISARANVRTDYSLTKLAGEQVLQSTRLEYSILRPSLVYGEGSYGGTSLIRGMAGFPFLVPLPGSGRFPFTPIHVADLARTVRAACEKHLGSGVSLEPVGPETMTLKELIAQYRAWLGFGWSRFLSVPMPAMRLLGLFGDLFGNGPIASNSLTQMVAGNDGNSEAFAQAVGFAPRRLNDVLRDRPAQVQDRWHAKLFFLVPALKLSLIIMWIASAWLGFWHGAAQTNKVIHSLELSSNWADPLRLCSSALDLAIAGMIMFARSTTLLTIVQLVTVLGYTIVISFALPDLWFDPLGPLLKNLPMLMMIAVYGAVGDRR